MVARTRITAAAACLTLVVSASASAATRYASPTGSGSTCGEFAPCDLPTAVNNADNGDFVLVGSGTYNLTGPLMTAASDVGIGGEPGAARPVINSTGAFLHDNADPAGLFLRDLRINTNATGAPSLYALSATLERVDIATTAGIYQAVAVRDLVMHDSVVRSVTAGGVAIVTTNATIIGSTIIANADTGSRAVSVYPPYFGGTPTAVSHIENSILVGGNNSIDLSPNTGSSAELTIDYSSYSGISANSGGVTHIGTHNVGLPLLVDLPGRTDIHQSPGSPTLNAGNPAALSSSMDYEGQGRFAGAAPDIGADEITTLPTVAPLAPTAITSRQGRVRATLGAGGLTTQYRFQYGTTTAYGKLTSNLTLPATARPTAVAALLSGLTPSTTYHYRLVATNALGTTRSTDRTFRTLPPPPVIGPISLPVTRVRTGTAFNTRFTLNKRASVVVTLTRLRAGHRVGTTCSLTATTGTLCTVRIRRAVLTSTLAAGSPVTRRIGGTPGGSRLVPGRYEIRIVAVDLVTGLSSAARTAIVTIIP